MEVPTPIRTKPLTTRSFLLRGIFDVLLSLLLIAGSFMMLFKPASMFLQRYPRREPLEIRTDIQWHLQRFL